MTLRDASKPSAQAATSTRLPSGVGSARRCPENPRLLVPQPKLLPLDTEAGDIAKSAEHATLAFPRDHLGSTTGTRMANPSGTLGNLPRTLATAGGTGQQGCGLKLIHGSSHPIAAKQWPTLVFLSTQAYHYSQPNPMPC